jgi:hypothetical protein
VLSLLPILPKASRMVADIQKTYYRMNEFRKDLIYRIDNDELIMDNDLWGSHTPIDLTIIPGDINIHMLSLSWPNIGSICTYKTIKIPLFLSTIAAEFETHLYAQEKEAKGRYMHVYTCMYVYMYICIFI